MTPLAFLVPGRLDQLTGGYLFDRRIVEGLRAGGRKVEVVELAGSFPDADGAARAAVRAALAGVPDNTAAVIDGLALLGGADSLEAAAKRLRLIGFVHHTLASETGLSAAESARIAGLEGGLLQLLRGAICPSEETAAALGAYGVAAARIAVVPPGTAKPAAPRAASRKAGPARLLTVASVTPRKGHLVLVAALARLTALDWRLRCIGSLIAFAEALAHGLPVIAARAGAVPRTVPESAGLLVSPGDAAALAAALQRVIAEPDLRRRLAAGALAAGALLPDWDQSVRGWAAAFDRLVA